MKKIITLILAAGLVSTAAFAQDHRHSYDNSYDVYSYPNQYPSYDRYGSYSSNWHGRAYYDRLAERRYREWERRMMYRHHRRDYDAYRMRSGVSLQLVIGNRRRY